MGIMSITKQMAQPEDPVEIVITPEMVAAGWAAIKAAEDEGDYFDTEAVNVFKAMLGASEGPKFTARISDLVRYVSD